MTRDASNAQQRDALRRLPSVESVLSRPALEPFRARVRTEYLTRLVREAIASERERVLSGVEPSSSDELAMRVAESVQENPTALRRVVNATGTLTHTNLGRSLLSDEALAAVQVAGANPVNVEYDLLAGERGHRDSLVESVLCRLTGAEAATVVNNNAAAVLIALTALAEGHEVVVSRGELVEIGGSFRIPDVMRAAGVTLREVGTTNRTHPGDYLDAVNERTALLLKVHPSNYRIEGFTREVALAELVALGRERGVPVMEDLGSGALLDLRRWNLPAEPIVSDRVRAGADLVTFSGDKLLGGPQAGVIVGRREPVERIRRHPLMRAVRVDKLILAALGATLALYEREPNPEGRLPMLRLMTRPVEELRRIAEESAARWRAVLEPAIVVAVEPSTAEFGSGAQPGAAMASVAVTFRAECFSSERIAWALRRARTPVITRVADGRVWLDFRALRDDDLPSLDAAIAYLAASLGDDSELRCAPRC
jgi:L-seryl-tRNA(Ser) seleniumtransferase